MGIGLAPKLDTLNLSKNETFVQTIPLKSGQTYPANTTAQIVIRDDAEIALATWNGTVSDGKASFSQTDVAALNAIPHGAKYDLLLNYASGSVVKFAYGRVVRNENRYPLTASQVTTNYALQFADNFTRTYVGKFWVPRNSSVGIGIHDNTSIFSNAPRTMGPNYALFNSAGCLWYAPLNSDSCTITASMVNLGAGKCTLVVCSDYSMSSWLGLQFETGISNNRLWVVKGSSPTEFTTLSTAVNNTLTTGDVYVVKYNNVSQTISCYKNGSLSPIISWTDTTDQIPNGAGYRYTGLVWNTSLFAPGAEPSAWSAQDGV
jgi:hypothetical protein